MSALTCPQTYYKTASEVRGVAVDMRGVLRQGEVLTGSPTVSASGITVASGAVNTTTILVNHEPCLPGQAITFTVSAGTAGTSYAITVGCGTSQSQTVQTFVTVVVAAS